MASEARVASRLPLHIDLTLPQPAVARQGQWFPLRVTVTNPVSSPGPVHLASVYAPPELVEVDDDMLMPREPIAPGESFVFVLPLRPRSLTAIPLHQIELHIEEDDVGAFWLRPRGGGDTLTVLPSLQDEIEVTLAPICPYDDATKVRVTLKHVGSTTFDRLVVAVHEQSDLRAGKRTTVFSSFGPGRRWETEVVVGAKQLVLDVEGFFGGREDVRELLRSDVPVAVQTTDVPFTFLDTQELVGHAVEIWGTQGGEPVQLEPLRDRSIAVRAGQTYELRIKPRHAQQGAEVVVMDAPNKVHARPRPDQPDSGGWFVFALDVAPSDQLWTKRERVHFQVEGKAARSFGEFYLSVAPERFRALRFATTLGVAVTVSALFRLWRIVDSRDDLDMIALVTDVTGNLSDNYEVFGVIAVPLVWLTLKAVEAYQGVTQQS